MVETVTEVKTNDNYKNAYVDGSVTCSDSYSVSVGELYGLQVQHILY